VPPYLHQFLTCCASPIAVITISSHESAVMLSRLGKLRRFTEIRANTLRAAKVWVFCSLSSIRMTDGEVPPVVSLCQIQTGCLVVVVVVVLMLLLLLTALGSVVVVAVDAAVVAVAGFVGVNAHLRLVFDILTSLRSGRAVIRNEDVFRVPKRIVQICSFVAAVATTMPGRKKMWRVWRGALEMVKRTSSVRALVTRSSHRCRRRTGFIAV